MTAAAPPLAADLTEGLRRLKLAAIRRLAPKLLLTREDQALGAGRTAAHPSRGRIKARDGSNARTRLRNAAFPVTKTLDESDLGACSVPSATFANLASLEWITAAENLCLIGPRPARANPTCSWPWEPRRSRLGTKVRYYTAAQLLFRVVAAAY